MKYINKNTKNIIETDCVIHSAVWEEIDGMASEQKPKKKPKKDDANG